MNRNLTIIVLFASLFATSGWSLTVTPTTRLNLRPDASTKMKPITVLTPGTPPPMLEVIDNKSKTGWYQVESESGKKGWVSAQYVREITFGTDENGETETSDDEVMENNDTASDVDEDAEAEEQNDEALEDDTESTVEE